MRSILEQAVIHHLNGDADKAAELFHEFVVARARQLHESMRNGEEGEECDEEAVSETYFGEEDLEKLEGGNGEEAADDAFGAGEEVQADLDDGNDEGDDLGDFGDDNFGDGEGENDLGDGDVDGGDFEDKLEELQAELERLTAEFEEFKGEEGDEGEDTDLANGLDDDMGDGDVAPATDFGGEEDDQDFDAFAESFTSELKKVGGQWPDQKTDGKGIASGAASNLTHNGRSPGLQKGIQARQGGSPNMSRQSQHTGFNRETPPSVGELSSGMKEKPRNSHPKASLSPVAHAKPVDGQEIGNGGKVKQNTRSPATGVANKSGKGK